MGVSQSEDSDSDSGPEYELVDPLLLQGDQYYNQDGSDSDSPFNNGEIRALAPPTPSVIAKQTRDKIEAHRLKEMAASASLPSHIKKFRKT
jgi:uncharacterized protein with NAD-binding domain and iron-sulfur cluster